MRRYAGLADHRKDKGVRRKPPRPEPRQAFRYIGRCGSRHAIIPPTKGRKTLRYVTDAELAAIGVR